MQFDFLLYMQCIFSLNFFTSSKNFVSLGWTLAEGLTSDPEEKICLWAATVSEKDKVFFPNVKTPVLSKSDCRTCCEGIVIFNKQLHFREKHYLIYILYLLESVLFNNVP